MTNFSDVPLPGLEFAVAPRTERAPSRRPYSATIAPTDAAIERFWFRVVHTPDCLLWTGAIAGGSGYGVNRAELHLVGYSTS